MGYGRGDVRDDVRPFAILFTRPRTSLRAHTYRCMEQPWQRQGRFESADAYHDRLFLAILQSRIQHVLRLPSFTSTDIFHTSARVFCPTLDAPRAWCVYAGVYCIRAAGLSCIILETETLAGTIKYPSRMSLDAKSLLGGLLIRNPQERYNAFVLCLNV